MIADPAALVNIMQINFLQPIYNLTFSNSLVACVVFMGVGAMCEIGFILANPWTSIIIAIFAECGTFITLVLGVHLGLTPPEAAAVASIGGAEVTIVNDYQISCSKNLATGEETAIDLPKSNVLELIMGQQGSVIARPSGTEPKVKFYYTAVGKTKADAQKLLDAMVKQMSV